MSVDGAGIGPTGTSSRRLHERQAARPFGCQIAVRAPQPGLPVRLVKCTKSCFQATGVGAV